MVSTSHPEGLDAILRSPIQTLSRRYDPFAPLLTSVHFLTASVQLTTLCQLQLCCNNTKASQVSHRPCSILHRHRAATTCNLPLTETYSAWLKPALQRINLRHNA